MSTSSRLSFEGPTASHTCIVQQRNKATPGRFYPPMPQWCPDFPEWRQQQCSSAVKPFCWICPSRLCLYRQEKSGVTWEGGEMHRERKITKLAKRNGLNRRGCL
ncbi:hypothetical protein TRVL_03030 [Trypanosoma vivax]|nr:hypothetical protein TRVL_03030 [Trypanosoma vivax]